MKYIALAITYLSFFTLIGYTCHISMSLTPLWALLLGPTIINSISKFNENQ